MKKPKFNLARLFTEFAENMTACRFTTAAEIFADGSPVFTDDATIFAPNRTQTIETLRAIQLQLIAEGVVMTKTRVIAESAVKDMAFQAWVQVVNYRADMSVFRDSMVRYYFKKQPDGRFLIVMTELIEASNLEKFKELPNLIRA